MSSAVIGRLAGAALLACFAAASPASAETDIVVGYPASLNIGVAPVVAAMELGYFAEEGLNVELQEFQGAAALVPQVANGAVTIGEGGPDPIVIANQPGKQRIPVKIFYNVSRKYHWRFVVPQNSPINSLADLRGKTIGVGSLANSHIPATRFILKENGLSESDYNLMAISIGAPAFLALMQGQVDAYNTWTANIANFEANGTALKYIPLPARFENITSSTYFASDETFAKSPEVLSGYARAYAKGSIICRDAPTWCITNFWKHYPNLKPRSGTDEENIAKQLHVLEKQNESYFSYPEGQPIRFGEFPKPVLDSLVSMLHEAGALETADFDIGTIFTNELIPQINEFDPAAIEKQAAGLK